MSFKHNLLLYGQEEATLITDTRFSGYGKHGLCTYISRENFQYCLEWIGKYGNSFDITEWDFEILNNPSGRTGTNRALHRIREKEKPNLICLGWNPENVAGSILSIIDLSKALGAIKHVHQPLHLQEPTVTMEVTLHHSRHSGLSIGANLAPGLWDAIESQQFTPSISTIAQKIRYYYEGRYNRPQYGELITPFNGRDGYNLQFNQPHGDGVWMVGSRNTGGNGYQFSDHNTDTFQQAHDHIVVMCILTQECQTLIGSASYADSCL